MAEIKDAEVKCEYCNKVVPKSKSATIEGITVCFDCLDKMPRDM
ncbi:MAG: hypothetical protein ACREBS_02985 [Nitrososphaerales archaeon]